MQRAKWFILAAVAGCLAWPTVRGWTQGPGGFNGGVGGSATNAVTSVGISAPGTGLTAGGSPVTATGTLSLTAGGLVVTQGNAFSLTLSNNLTIDSGHSFNVSTGNFGTLVLTNPLPSSAVALALLTNSIGCGFGSGSALAPGSVCYAVVPYNCTIVAANMIGVPSGSAVIEVERCTQTQFDGGATHPVSGDKLTASAPPTITTSTKNGNAGDTTLTGWTTSLNAGDIIQFSVTSCTTITNLSLALRVTHAQ